MADTKTSLFQRLMKNPQIMKIAEQMFNSMQQEDQINFVKRPNISAALHIPGSDDSLSWLQGKNPGNIAAQALAGSGPAVTGDMGGNFGDLGALALGAAKNHPFKTIGLMGLGAGNVGGLMDNNKFGGQLAGLGLGGLGALSLASGNPYMAAMLTMGGGELGALFDKLRARKELEEQQGYPNAGNPIAMMNRR